MRQSRSYNTRSEWDGDGVLSAGPFGLGARFSHGLFSSPGSYIYKPTPNSQPSDTRPGARRRHHGMSSKRQAGRQLTRDDPDEDEDRYGPPIVPGVWQKADEATLAQRVIRKVKRPVGDAGSLPLPPSNPFANVELTSGAAANPFANIQLAPPAPAPAANPFANIQLALPASAPEERKTLHVAVGSKNPVKVASVRNAMTAAFPTCCIECHQYDVPSGVPDQPWGQEETRQGALARAQAAHAAHCAASASAPDFAVGLEGGVVEERLGDAHPAVPGVGTVVSCFAFMAVLSAGRGLTPRWGIASTASFALPPRIVALMRGTEGRPPMELGDADDFVFSDVNSKQKGGTVAKVTKGLIDRTAYYEHALKCALCPFMHEDTPSLYREP